MPMIRKKVKLAFITNDYARKTTYRKRKRCLLKKMSELSTLCDIQACAIIFSPYDYESEVWPNPLGVQRVIQQFTRMNEMEQTKKMYDQETFLRQRIDKLKKQLRKQQQENRETEITLLMFRMLSKGKEGLQTLKLQDLNDLGRKIEQRLNEIKNMALPLQ